MNQFTLYSRVIRGSVVEKPNWNFHEYNNLIVKNESVRLETQFKFVFNFPTFDVRRIEANVAIVAANVKIVRSPSFQQIIGDSLARNIVPGY